MTWVTVEDTSVVVDTQDVGWKLRYAPQSMTYDDYKVAAAIASSYAHLTDPMVDSDDAVAALERAREGTRVVIEERQQQLLDAVAREWVLDCEPTDGTQTFLLGPFTHDEAVGRALWERKTNPDVRVSLRKTMP
jgi:hypothetical protein